MAQPNELPATNEKWQRGSRPCRQCVHWQNETDCTGSTVLPPSERLGLCGKTDCNLSQVMKGDEWICEKVSSKAACRVMRHRPASTGKGANAGHAERVEAMSPRHDRLPGQSDGCLVRRSRQGCEKSPQGPHPTENEVSNIAAKNRSNRKAVPSDRLIGKDKFVRN